MISYANHPADEIPTFMGSTPRDLTFSFSSAETIPPICHLSPGASIPSEENDRSRFESFTRGYYSQSRESR